ncbi:MAG: hypothetical protein MJE66_25475 [Proteobacteria bacterium]|nr:hypothetical protein [Pseudomonadota bacterium]
MSDPWPREKVLERLPEDRVGWVIRAVRAAESRALDVYLVGGCARDLLLDRPVRDVDLVVDSADGADALELAREAAPVGGRVVAHERFGTVAVEAEGRRIDLASVRSEEYPEPGALPKVSAGTLADDLARRDFSVNALAYRLTGDAGAGRWVDPGEGRADLERGQLRVLHDRSFHDDPTRAVRAARLSVRLGFRLSRGSRAVLRDALRDGAFGRVSGDRLRRELQRVFDESFLGQNPAETLRRLSDWHVLSALEPGLSLPREAAVPLRRFGKVLAAPPWKLGRTRAWVAGTMLWLAPLQPSMRRRTLARFSVRGGTSDRIAAFPKARDAWLRGLARARGRGTVDACLGDIDPESLLALFASAETSVRRRIARWALEDRQRRLPVTGDDLVREGISGPAVGRALERVRAAFLDGAVANREEALALAREVTRSGARKTGRRRGRAPRKRPSSA